MCRFDFTQCVAVPPGASCEVRCRPPYVGGVATARCLTTGSATGAGTPLQVPLPPCELPESGLRCYDPEAAPEGYERELASGHWRCAPGFLGQPQRTCVLGPDCRLEAAFSGCAPPAPCRGLADEPGADAQALACRFDTSGCTDVQPGTSCSIACRRPFAGTPTSASCPAGNTDPARALERSWPRCRLICPDPWPIPVGYRKDANGWQCAGIHAGVAVKNCSMDADCRVEVQLSGCVVPRCATPSLEGADTCRFDASGCRGLLPGQSCQVRCRAPYVGAPASARCPPDNLEPGAALQVQWPSCSLQCPVDDPAPPGYVQGANGRWGCAQGYTGRAIADCSIATNCSVRTTLQGCRPLAACASLNDSKSARGCSRFDASACASLSPGSACTVHCRPPFTGSPVSAACPSDNTDPARELQLSARGLPNCTVPECRDDVPAGYMKTAGGWRCAPGYAGAALTSCSCSGALLFRGCVPTVPCRKPELARRCRYNASSCAGGVLPGASCEVACSKFFVGTPATATCPADNTDPEGEPDYVAPTCTLSCPVPIPAPSGYVLTSSGWQCAEGFIGTAAPSCSLASDCTAELSLTGCNRLLPCTPPLLDERRYDTSACRRLPPNETCAVACREPYVGTAGAARCPADNIERLREAVPFDAPSCSLRCDTVPPGYSKGAAGWQCTAGLAGIADALCKPTPPGSTCRGELALSGCGPPVPCAAPALDACSMNTSECLSVPLGGTCKLHCQPPYQGEPVTAWCPESNTDAEGGLQWPFLPQCALPACPDPTPPPPGYVLASEPAGSNASGAGGNASGAGADWECAEGYAGRAAKLCSTNASADCAVEGSLTGCAPLQPCRAPEVQHACEVNASECFQDLEPGEVCQVQCRWPYTGPSIEVMCPSGNTDPNFTLGWSTSNCTLDCSAHAPPGYVETGDAWRCSEGYTGEANVTCHVDDSCSFDISFTGCEALVPCSAPEIEDCGIDASDCGAVEPGMTCELRCASLYEGAPTQARCPSDNIDPSRPLELVLPQCSLHVCPDPASIPQGYVKNGSVWQCEAGYGGSASLECEPMLNCSLQLSLHGCAPVVPCLALVVDDCAFNTSACPQALAPGESCEVHCRAPFYSVSSSVARCPEGNTDPSQVVQWPPLECQLPSWQHCSDPDPVPPGYNLTAAGWQCVDGYVGNVTERCAAMGPDCLMTTTLSGCEPLAACQPPSCQANSSGCWTLPPGFPSFDDDCRYNASGCMEDYAPGTSCQISCKAPFVGTPGTVSCPAGNTDPNQTVLLLAPQCSAACPDPGAPPAGYERVAGSWRCTDGYTGSPSADCRVDENCTAQLVLEGCSLLAACADLNLTGCIFETNCSGVDPGDHCEVRCKAPYLGEATVGTCPEGNTDPQTPVEHTLPDCSQLSCPDPVPLPTGYAQAATGGWQCAAGYAGMVSRTCVVNASCGVRTNFSGCLPLANCTPADERVLDSCRYNVSSCQTALVPGASCEVRCRAPFYVGGLGSGRCPADNTDPTSGPHWDLPSCSLDCPEVSGIPAGYEKSTGSWRCAPNYTGTALPSCTVRELYRSSTQTTECLVDVSLSGCVPLAACGLPELDPCVYDASGCAGGSVWPNGTCEVRCRAPHLGAPARASCPAGNTDPGRPADLVAPDCVLDCPEPLPALEAYEKVGPLAWQCAPGYAGVVEIESCSIDDRCLTELVLSGCDKVVPCVPPPQVLGMCALDATDCQDFLSGTECEIRCTEPCSGSPARMSCPPNNTDASKHLEGLLPLCAFECDRIPPGYVKLADGWHCAEGYVGSVEEGCSAFGDCDELLVLGGCEPLRSCAAPATDEACRLDFAPCDDREPGTNCTVACRPPYYTGHPGVAVCPEGNTDPLQPLLWSRQHGCEWSAAYSCADPDPPPEGYNWTLSGWQCSEGFAGTPARSCTLKGEQCRPEAVLSGCLPLVACRDPALEGCKFDTSDCSSVPPGGSCTVACKTPYAGEESTATCPGNNTNPLQDLEYSLPQCDLSCPDPDPMPAAFSRGGGSWQCGQDYAGSVTAECSINESCYWEWNLSGCEPLVPCLDVNTSTCEYDLTVCTPLWPGQPCTVSCKTPYTPKYVGGAWSTGSVTCPGDNVDPAGAPQVILPQCELDCPDPNPAPQGYAGPPFTCAPGFTGTARKECSMSEDCSTVLSEVVGCARESPCLDPDVRSLDVCTYDTTPCVGVPSGASCEMGCRAPLVVVGSTGRTHCPAGNTDPLRRMQLVLPQCREHCPASSLTPPGYERTASGWRCAHGYDGQAVVDCPRTGPNCIMEGPRFSGCEQTQPCAPLASDPCMIDASNCTGVEAGGSCEVRCAAPFLGNSTVATCPPGNLDPFRQPDLQMPECRLECPAPNPPPPGYRRSDSGWQCAQGYVGDAVESCQVDDHCGAAVRLDGCTPLVHCAVPALDPCLFNVSSCMQVLPGASCEIPCLFEGNASLARCPAGNVDPTRVWDFFPEPCVPACPVPEPLPSGYYRNASGWECAEGYIGNATDSCIVGESCEVMDLLLEGCNLTVPCANLTLDDDCSFSASACAQPLDPGESCEVPCREPHYAGSPGLASCPVGNTRPAQPPEWSAPDCRPAGGLCPAPEPPPPGYEASAGGGWHCAEGYAGAAEERCVAAGSDCRLQALLEGCAPLAPCAEPAAPACPGGLGNCTPGALGPPGLGDACRFDASNCTELPPGASCTIGCKAPFVGSSGAAACPEKNTDRLRLPDLHLPECHAHCPEPDTPPAGYARSGDGWRCAEGFAGHALATCGTDLDCNLTELQLSGCTPVAACAPPVLDECLFELPACSEVPPGGHCLIHCRGDGNATPGMASCPDGNTALQRPADFQAPNCRTTGCPASDQGLANTSGPVIAPPAECMQSCAEPSVAPAGYEMVANGSQRIWRCADGYGGEATGHCFFNGTCAIEFVLTGCAPLAPCSALELNMSCELEVVGCSEVLPGSSCEVRCRPPYSGVATIARCPADNTDQMQELLYTLPSCDCPDPSPVPAGYTRNASGWTCASGYAGEARKTCTGTTGCSVSATLSGCGLVVPCPSPVVDSCRHDASSCPLGEMAPGTSCEVRCRESWVGIPGFARCPHDNTDPAGGLEWRAPQCDDQECADPVPAGYMKTDLGWQCAEGYFGTVSLSCDANARCNAGAYLFHGCYSPMPCLPPTLDACMYDVSNCSGVQPGQACEIRCRSPYIGGSTIARCPAGNTDPQAQPLYSPPSCVLTCPEPAAPPAPYVRTSMGWSCADGHVGRAQAACAPRPACGSALELSGCRPLVPCAALDTSALVEAAGCSLDAEDCEAPVPAGGGCELRCRAPYVGAAGRAECPAGNTEPSTEPRLLRLPRCSLPASCGAPSVQEGYTASASGRWRCADGYAGRASWICTVDPNCTASTLLSGCEPLASCAPFPSTRIAGTNCEYVESGCSAEACSLLCPAPFVGNGGVATCPANNTDPTRAFGLDDTPDCRCPHPEEAPAGYIRLRDGWSCAAGYVGQASKVCPCGGAGPVLEGCVAPVPCGAVGFEDTDERTGIIGGHLDFGPARLGGELSESGVVGYAVFFADQCGQVLGEALAGVQVAAVQWPQRCCRAAAYRATIPPTVSPVDAASLVVVALTGSGMSPEHLGISFSDLSWGGGGGAGGGSERAELVPVGLHSGAGRRDGVWGVLAVLRAAVAAMMMVMAAQRLP